MLAETSHDKKNCTLFVRLILNFYETHSGSVIKFTNIS